jgi:hypothetical protein
MSCVCSSGHFGPASTRAAQQRAATARPTACSAARARSLPTPGRNLGLGQESSNLPGLEEAQPAACRSRPLVSIRRLGINVARTKTPPRPSDPKTLAHILFLLSSPTATPVKTERARGHLVTREVTGEEDRTAPVPSPSSVRALAHGRARPRRAALDHCPEPRPSRASVRAPAMAVVITTCTVVAFRATVVSGGPGRFPSSSYSFPKNPI